MAYDIYQKYKDLFDSQVNGLAQKRDAALQGYKNQQNDVTNQYTDAINNLNAKSQATKNQYAQMYNQLDQQNTQANNDNYTDRNNVDVAVNQNLNRIQELMAKNGWLGGGENLQAQLQSNTDRTNGFGTADGSLRNKLTTILNNRNKYKSDEQNAMNDITNQLSSTEREKNSRLQAILDAINQENANYQSNITSLKAQSDAQAANEVSQYRAAAQKAARSSSSSLNSAVNSRISDVNDIVNGNYNLSEKQRILSSAYDDYKSQQGDQAEYMANYVLQALGAVQGQMQDYVNSGRYADVNGKDYGSRY